MRGEMDSRNRKELEECVVRILQHGDMDVLNESKLRKLAQEETGFDLTDPDNRMLVKRVVERFFINVQLRQQGREEEESHHDENVHYSTPSVQPRQLRQQPSAHSRPPPPPRRRNLIAADDDHEEEEEGVTNVDSQRSSRGHAAPPAAAATGRNDKRRVPIEVKREEPESEDEPASKKKKRPPLVHEPRRTLTTRWSAINEDQDRGDDIVVEEWDAPEDKEEGRKRESTVKDSKITRRRPKGIRDCYDDDGDGLDEISHLREDDEEQTAAMKKVLMKRVAAASATDQRESDRDLRAKDEEAMEVAERRPNKATITAKKKFPEMDVGEQRRRRMMVMDSSEDDEGEREDEREADEEDEEEPRKIFRGRERKQHVTKQAKRQVVNNGDTIVCQLSGKRYVTVNELNGRALVTIREYYEEENLLSSQKGISFTEDQWNAFKDGIPKIDAALRRLRR